jgi:hypothetical protein
MALEAATLLGPGSCEVTICGRSEWSDGKGESTAVAKARGVTERDARYTDCMMSGRVGVCESLSCAHKRTPFAAAAASAHRARDDKFSPALLSQSGAASCSFHTTWLAVRLTQSAQPSD